jgi:hypothetical protein
MAGLSVMKQQSIKSFLCHQAKSPKSTTDCQSPSEDGQNRERLSTSSHPQEDIYTTWYQLPAQGIQELGGPNLWWNGLPNCGHTQGQIV